jgi:hypothetical protein
MVSWPILRYYPGIYLEGIRKGAETIVQHTWWPGRGLNSAEYEEGTLTTATSR